MKYNPKTNIYTLTHLQPNKRNLCRGRSSHVSARTDFKIQDSGCIFFSSTGNQINLQNYFEQVTNQPPVTTRPHNLQANNTSRRAACKGSQLQHNCSNVHPINQVETQQSQLNTQLPSAQHSITNNGAPRCQGSETSSNSDCLHNQPRELCAAVQAPTCPLATCSAYKAAREPPTPPALHAFTPTKPRHPDSDTT